MSKDSYIPATIRFPVHSDLDSCIKHVDHNIEKLSKLLTTNGKVAGFEVLNYVIPIILNICKIIQPPTRGHENDTFCIPTRFNSCHKDDQVNLECELKKIKSDDIYRKLLDFRHKAAAHTHILYQDHGGTQRALVDVAVYLIKREEQLINLVDNIKSLIYDTEISVRKQEGKPLNVDIIEVGMPDGTSRFVRVEIKQDKIGMKPEEL